MNIYVTNIKILNKFALLLKNIIVTNKYLITMNYKYGFTRDKFTTKYNKFIFLLNLFQVSVTLVIMKRLKS